MLTYIIKLHESKINLVTLHTDSMSIQHSLCPVKEIPNQDLSWPENVNQKGRFFHMQAWYGCSINRRAAEVVFCLSLLLFASNWSSSWYSHDTSLFTNENQGMAGSWNKIHFCHSLCSHSWCHIHRLPNIKWLRSSRFFCNFQMPCTAYVTGITYNTVVHHALTLQLSQRLFLHYV